MDPKSFDALTRGLGAAVSRRGLGRAVSGGLAALAGWPLATIDTDAKKKRGKKRKQKGKQKATDKKRPSPPPPPPPLPFNQFGCLDVGQACRGENANCCSGICNGAAPGAGQPDTSTCVAHDEGICALDSDTCTLGSNVPCNKDSDTAFCVRTTGNAGFCGDFTAGADKLCRDCSKDTDCQAEFGVGAACVVLGGVCTPLCAATGRTACVPPGA